MADNRVRPIQEAEGESIPVHAQHSRREHYIPISKTELTRALTGELPRNERRAFRELCDLLSTAVHLEFQIDLQHIKDAYALVNPDQDTLSMKEVTDAERDEHVANLFDRLEHVLKRGNFLQLSDQDVEKAIAASSDWGVRLDIDLGIFDRLMVYARGDIVGKRVRRRLWNFYRPEVVDVPIYQRVAAIFRLRDHETLEDDAETNIVYLKLLKNVPKQDVDMMLPGSRVRMSILDSGKILLPTVSGIVIAMIKIFKGALLLVFAGFYGMLAFFIFIVGTLAYGFKSVSGYQRIRDKYELNRTKSLYYQHLDNNAGVLFRLIDEGEEQELRETILAYFLLWQHAGTGGWTDQTLDQRAERHLREILQLDIDFEVEDALLKLRRFKLIAATSNDGWRAVPIEDAIANVSQLMHDALP